MTAWLLSHCSQPGEWCLCPVYALFGFGSRALVRLPDELMHVTPLHAPATPRSSDVVHSPFVGKAALDWPPIPHPHGHGRLSSPTKKKQSNPQNLVAANEHGHCLCKVYTLYTQKAHEHKPTCTHMRTNTQVHRDTHMYPYVHTRTQIYMCTEIHMYTRTHTYARAHTRGHMKNSKSCPITLQSKTRTTPFELARSARENNKAQSSKRTKTAPLSQNTPGPLSTTVNRSSVDRQLLAVGGSASVFGGLGANRRRLGVNRQ